MELWNLPLDLQERILNEAYPHPLTRAAAEERRPLLTESRRLLRYEPGGATGSVNMAVVSRPALMREQGVLRQLWRRPIPSVYRAIKLSMKRVYELILRLYNTAFETVWPGSQPQRTSVAPS